MFSQLVIFIEAGRFFSELRLQLLSASNTKRELEKVEQETHLLAQLACNQWCQMTSIIFF
jgi:hypothetical protein